MTGILSPQRLAEARKALVAAAGVLAQLIALGVLHGAALHWTQLALSVLAAVGVYVTRNARAGAGPDVPVAPPTFTAGSGAKMSGVYVAPPADTAVRISPPDQATAFQQVQPAPPTGQEPTP